MQCHFVLMITNGNHRIVALAKMSSNKMYNLLTKLNQCMNVGKSHNHLQFMTINAVGKLWKLLLMFK